MTPRPTTAERFAPFGTTIFTEMTLLAQKHGAVNLAQGFPDFDGPEYIRAAAAHALQAGHNQYARMFGVPTLNRALADEWQRLTGHAIDPDTQVTVTSGCTEAIAASLLGLINPGDEVVLFEPYYDSYLAGVAMAGGVARVVTLRAPSGPGGEFTFDEAELRRAFTPRTRAILVNTPHNPTGKVFTRAELTLIAELCQHHGVIALCDEVYEHLIFEPGHRPHVRLATLPGMAERTLTLSSLGKSFSLTGWKIGWAIGPADLTRAVRAAHQFLTFATATPLQHAAAAALSMHEQRERALADLVATLSANREFLLGVLERCGVRTIRPHGAYFIVGDWSGSRFARPGRTLDDDRAFCTFLTTEVGVAAIPPSVFYTNKGHGRSLARFAFCKRPETLQAAAERLEGWAG